MLGSLLSCFGIVVFCVFGLVWVCDVVWFGSLVDFWINWLLFWWFCLWVCAILVTVWRTWDFGVVCRLLVCRPHCFGLCV